MKKLVKRIADNLPMAHVPPVYINGERFDYVQRAGNNHIYKLGLFRSEDGRERVLGIAVNGSYNNDSASRWKRRSEKMESKKEAIRENEPGECDNVREDQAETGHDSSSISGVKSVGEILRDMFPSLRIPGGSRVA